MAAVITGAEVIATTGATPAVSLLVAKLPVPVWSPATWVAVTATGPSARPLTSMPAVAQRPPLHGAVADTEPTCTCTLLPSTEQVPETEYAGALAAVMTGADVMVTTGVATPVLLLTCTLADPTSAPTVC